MILMLDASGEILGTNDSFPFPAPAHVLEQFKSSLQPPMVRVVDVPPMTPAYWYVPEGSRDPVLKPEMSGTVITKLEVAADETDAAVITDLPPGAIVTVDGGNTLTVDEGGKVSLAFVNPGQHQVHVGLPGHRGKVFQINSTEVKKDHKPKKPTSARGAAKEVVVGIAKKDYAARARERLRIAFDFQSAAVARSVNLASEAQDFLMNGKSPVIERLAAASGSEAGLYARAILADAERYIEIEERRERASKALRDAIERDDKRAEIEKMLNANGVPKDEIGGIGTRVF